MRAKHRHIERARKAISTVIDICVFNEIRDWMNEKFVKRVEISGNHYRTVIDKANGKKREEKGADGNENENQSTKFIHWSNLSSLHI